MPFVIVQGLESTMVPKQTLRDMRKAIVNALVESMKVTPTWCGVFFPVDMLDEAPRQTEDGGNTVYVQLHTAKLHNKPDALELAKHITEALAEAVWQTLGGVYEVEVFIIKLDPEWGCLKEAKS